jgi:hypothetical protein
MVHIFVLVTGTWVQIQTPGYTLLQENCNNAIYDKWLAFDNEEGVSFAVHLEIRAELFFSAADSSTNCLH